MQEMLETQLRSLGQEEPLEKESATHSSILAWKIPWTEEPSGLQSEGSQRVRHDWTTEHVHVREALHRVHVNDSGCGPPTFSSPCFFVPGRQAQPLIHQIPPVHSELFPPQGNHRVRLIMLISLCRQIQLPSACGSFRNLYRSCYLLGLTSPSRTVIKRWGERKRGLIWR